MMKVVFTLMLIVLVSSVGFSQSMAKSGQWGIQTSLGVASSPVAGANTVGFKFLASEDFAIRFEAGLASISPPGGGGSTTGFEVGAGFEYHLAGGMGNVSPYLGLQAGFGGGSVPGGGTTPTSISVVGVFGGEYFFSSNFSWAGEIGLGFNSTGASGTTTTSIGTGSATLIATWYIN